MSRVYQRAATRLRLGDETDGLGTLHTVWTLARPFFLVVSLKEPLRYSETGFIGDLADMISTIVNAATGAPSDAAAAAASKQATAALELEKARLDAQASAGTVGQLLPGVPNWALAAAGLGVAYYIYQSGGS